MLEIKLRDSDKVILRELQRDCKQSMRTLSRKISVPITTLHRRIKRLEELGVIIGYHAQVDGKKVGKAVTAFMVLELKREIDAQAVGKKLAKLEGVQEVHYAAGQWDLLIKLKVSDLDSYYKFSAEGTMQIEEIAHAIGILAPRTFKEECMVEI